MWYCSAFHTFLLTLFSYILNISCLQQCFYYNIFIVLLICCTYNISMKIVKEIGRFRSRSSMKCNIQAFAMGRVGHCRQTYNAAHCFENVCNLVCILYETFTNTDFCPNVLVRISNFNPIFHFMRFAPLLCRYITHTC